MINKERIRNILVVRNDRFGEFLLNIPAIRALKETYPQARLTLAVSPGVYELAGLLDFVDKVLVWDLVKKNLKKHKFDICVILNPTKEANLRSFWAGIPWRAGYDRKWGFLLTHKLKDTKHLGNRHEVDCNLELVELAGAGTQNKSLSIKVNEGLFPEFTGKEIIAIHPFTSDPVKQWPFERFEELALRIRQELDLAVIMLGLSASNFNLKGGIINLINKTTLPELAALLKRCSLLISCDSGPVHLSAAVGTPVIALFRNDLPGKTAKRWGPWGSGHIVIENDNLSKISVNDIVTQVKRLMLH